MRFVLGTLIVVLAAACDAVDERSGCARSSDCPAGQYCAVTDDGSVCWADASPPVVSDVTLTCDTTPCLRDGTLRIEATVGDDHEVAGAEARLDLDPARPIALTRSGTRWGADVPLRGYAFDAFERPVVATVTGSDGARTTSAAVASGAVQVTRLRWIYTATNALTSPAVMDDGTVVVGVANTSDQLLAVRPDGTKAWSLTVGTGQITAAPAVGRHAVWAGNRDGSLRAAALDGSGILPDVGVVTGGVIDGSIALRSIDAKEWAFATSSTGFVGAASTVPNEDPSVGTGVPFRMGPVIRADSKVCALSSGASATLRCSTFDDRFTPDPAVETGVNVSTDIAVDAFDNLWTGSNTGRLNRTSSAGISEEVASLTDEASGSAVVLQSGAIVIGDAKEELRCIQRDGAVSWSRRLDGDPLITERLSGTMVLAGTTAGLLVTASSGVLFALDAEGNELWRRALGSGAELRPPNIFTPAGQSSTGVLSTAYVSSANGKLYAVIVDGQLDTASPWPKAFHDARNTNNAGTQP